MEEVAKQLASPAYWILTFILGGLCTAVLGPYLNRLIDRVGGKLSAVAKRQIEKRQAQWAAEVRALAGNQRRLERLAELELRGILDSIFTLVVGICFMLAGMASTLVLGFKERFGGAAPDPTRLRWLAYTSFAITGLGMLVVLLGLTRRIKWSAVALKIDAARGLRNDGVLPPPP